MPWGLYFSKAIFKGLIFGGAYLWSWNLRFKIDRARNEIYHFCFVFLCIWGQFPSRSPRWPYIWRGDFGGAHTRRDLFREFYGIYDRECRILPSLLRQRCFKQSHKIMHKLLLGNYRVTLISWMRCLQGDLLQKIAR